MNKIIFILNPSAGKGLKLNKDYIKEKFDDREVIFVEEREGREKFIKDSIEKGVRDFVVVGGDGTVNNIASLLMNTPARLGIIPSGSGNGLARDLKIPMDSKQALEIVKMGNPKKIDVGFINNLPFFCTRIGFDAVCAYDFAHKKHKRGLWNYVKIVLKNYFKFQPISAKINGEKGQFFSITFANAEQYGNNAYIAPHASLDDGILDCSIILPHSKILSFWLAMSLMRKNIDKLSFFRTHKAKRFTLDEVSDKRIHIDGESLELSENRIQVKVLEKALNVFV